MEKKLGTRLPGFFLASKVNSQKINDALRWRCSSSVDITLKK